MKSHADPETGDALPLPVISATYLTGATLMLHLPLAAAEARVAAASAALGPSERLMLDADVCQGETCPFLIDIWQLKQGRLELAGLTQHEWSELAYGTLGGAFGMALGALRGAGRAVLAGSPLVDGPRRGAGAIWQRTLASTMQGALDGLGSGVTTLGRVGRTLSENSARSLGNYVEVMFSIPGVRLHDARRPGEGAGPFTLSLGVYTDSKPACAIDKNFRYGLGKTLAAVEMSQGEHSQLIRVIDPLGREMLSASIRALEPCERPPAAIARWLHAPLLGIHTNAGAKTTAVARWSCLRRHFDSGIVRTLAGELRLPAGPFGLPSGDWSLFPHCIAYDRVWSEITLPGTPS